MVAQVSERRAYPPRQVLDVVSELAGVSPETLASRSQVRKLGRVRSAAAHLLRVDCGLGIKQVAPLVGRTAQTVCDFSRNARLALADGGDIADVIVAARHVLEARTEVARDTPTSSSHGAGRRPTERKPTWVAVPHLRTWRIRAHLDQAQLAGRSHVARETIARLENGRPARLQSVRRLAEALVLAPSELTGRPELDALTGDAYRRCTDCTALRPLRGFVQVKGSPYVYLRCRISRAARARERYQSDPLERARQIARAQRSQARRLLQQRTS